MISFPFMGLVLGAVLIGTAIGTLTGLLPGLHTNNVAAILVVAHVPLTLWLLTSMAGAGLGQEEADVIIVCLIASAAITHTFVNFIPATFLGAPESDTALSVLPGHRMLLEGRGNVAVRLSAQGSLGALIGCLFAVLALRLIMGAPIEFYDRFRPFIPGILMLIVILLIMSEGNSSKRHRRIHRTWSFRDKLRPCLLVEDIEEVTKENLSPGIDAEIPVVRPWMLSPLQGERVRAKGTVYVRDDRWNLWDRDSGAKVRMVFEEGAGPPKERPAPWKQVWVTGKVCRSLGSGSRTRGMSWAIILFILSGTLGFALLSTRGFTNICWSPVSQTGLAGGGWTMVPLFTGLFGLPTLLVSYSTMPVIPQQDPEASETLTRRQKARGLLTGTFTGSFVGWFPGITSAEAGVLVSQVASDSDPDQEVHRNQKGSPETEEFIVSISAINTANAISNFVALFVILKARSGAARAAQDIFGHDIQPWVEPFRPPWALLVVLVSLLISGLLAFLVTIKLGKIFANNFQKISYRRLVVANIIFLLFLVLMFSGPFGLCIMAIATLLGLIPPLVGVKRVHLMGCLILPLLLNWCGPSLFGGWLL